MPAAIPQEIQQFITNHVRSVEQLEILLLIHGTPHKIWSVQSVYSSILSSKSSVERWLEEFVRTGFCQKTTDEPANYFFSASGEIELRLSALAELYKIKPARVIEAIFKKDLGAAQSFADAFKIKRLP